MLFRLELDRIARTRGARVRYLVGAGITLSPELLAHLVPGLVDRDVYLCASPGTSAAVRESLLHAGLPEHQLHEERFAF